MAKEYSTKEEISYAARQLFLTVGFENASYAAIAEASGKQKTNVQKHFPKKDLFVYDFFSDLLTFTNAYFVEHGNRPEDYYQSLYVVGQIHFAFLLSTPEMRRFTVDILSHRDLTETLINLDMDWATQYLDRFSLKEEEQFRDNVALVMGGVYELIYRRLTTNRDIDPQKLQKQAMNLLIQVQGIDPSSPSAQFQDDLLSPDEYEKAVAYLMEKMFRN